jgi:hypothetical protein
MRRAEEVGKKDLSEAWVRNNITYIKTILETEDYGGLIPKDNTSPLNATRKMQERQ